MVKKNKYNEELFNTCLLRDGASRIGDYEKYVSHVKLKFICKCGTEHSKLFRDIKRFGAMCVSCTNNITVAKRKKTHLERYGVEHSCQSHEMKQKMKNTNLERYGVEHISSSPEIKEKIKQKNLEKFGVECTLNNPEVRQKGYDTMLKKYNTMKILQNDNFKEKKKQTMLRKYGVEHSLQSVEFREKAKKTCLKKFGVECALQSPEIKEKIKQTNLERYGVEYTFQNSELLEKGLKNAMRLKSYIMPSGDVRQVQGYEPFAIDILIKTHLETDIKTGRKDVPSIPYTIDDKQHYYHPDIFIPSENKIIEVKSTWTYTFKQSNIPHKAAATKAAGYAYEIWVFDEKGNKTVY